MKTRTTLSALWLACVLCLPARVFAEGTWTALAHTAPNNIGTMLLLPDGTVMAQQFAKNNNTSWYKLSPDANGHYANGNWSNLSSMHFNRLYYSSVVLQDGRVFIAGAEYGNGTTNAEIYDPVANSWSIVSIPSGIINLNNTVNSNFVN